MSKADEGSSPSPAVHQSLSLIQIPSGFQIELGGRVVIQHSEKHPCVGVARAESRIESISGFFKVKEKVHEKKYLRQFEILDQADDAVTMVFEKTLKVSFRMVDGRLHVACEELTGRYDRVRLTMPAKVEERVYGGGEQLGRLNLRGKRVPVWISEPGVGRRFDALTIGFAMKTGHIPRWYNTYYGMPVWSSSQGVYCISESSAYSEMDFREKDSHSVYVWDARPTFVIGSEPTLSEAVGSLSLYLGRQPKLPSWVYDGMWLGMQGGSEVVKRKIETARRSGITFTTVWCQDWEGRRKTKFGSQLRWAWEWDDERYPDLPIFIAELREQGIRYLGYNNTFLTPGSAMYDEAIEKGYVVKRKDGTPYLVDVPFDPAAMVDFTNPEAFAWLKEIIKSNMIGIGLSGWMADFGEMIPHDALLASGESGETYHNRYPVDWARLNREVVEETGMQDEVIYFMRAGFTGASRYTSMNWNGDQMVDWTKEDGLPSAIMGALSLGMSGLGYVHSDIGGYTTLAYKRRTPELLIRWSEYSAFTQTMRTHEGNRPEPNAQFDTHEETLQILARMSKVFAMLKPYHIALSEEYQATGLPPQRPVCLQYPTETKTFEAWPFQYLYGPDLLVAPVIKPGKDHWQVRLPKESDTWTHMWTGEEFVGGRAIDIDAPYGKIPVFYRTNSPWKELFSSLRSV